MIMKLNITYFTNYKYLYEKVKPSLTNTKTPCLCELIRKSDIYVNLDIYENLTKGPSFD